MVGPRFGCVTVAVDGVEQVDCAGTPQDPEHCCHTGGRIDRWGEWVGCGGVGGVDGIRSLLYKVHNFQTFGCSYPKLTIWDGFFDFV